MREVVVQGVRYTYDTIGEGFPLVLAPAPEGGREVWTPYRPLLGELCRTIAYARHSGEETPPQGELPTSTRAADTLGKLLQVLGLARVYLASQTGGWPMALHFALQHPERLEGLVLLGAHAAALDIAPGVMSLAARLHDITVPTLVLIEDQGHAALPYVEILAERLPRCTRVVVSDSILAGSAGALALRLGHAMMRFLLHCERQRNLVRGASFLL